MRVASWFALGALLVIPPLLTACGSSDDAGGAGGTGGGAGASAGGTGGSAGSAAGAAGTAGTDGGAGASGAAGMGGAAGSPATGQPITAPDDTWTWVPFAGAHCRDGSTTGIGVNLNSASTKVAIYLEGGGACFNSLTCASNPKSFNESSFNAREGSLAGIFDRTRAENPLKDWNYVYVPYCTGDVHAGDKPDGSVPSVAGTQQFVGYSNMTQYLDRLVPTFPNATQVLLTGASAGGFGSAANFLQTQQYFASVPVDLLDDSGPPMGTTYIPPCLQDQLRTLWGMDGTILKACGSHCADPSNYLSDLLVYSAQKFSTHHLALVSSTGDGTIRTFLAFGQNNCTFGQLSPQQYQQGLLDLRDTLKAYPNFGSYYIGQCADNPCTHHTWIGDNASFYGTTVSGTSLPDFVGALVTGSTSNVGP